MAGYEEIFRLWEGEAPLTRPEDKLLTETVQRGPSGIERVTNVTVPTLTYYPCTRNDTENHVRPAVLVCPGGAYNILAWNLEGRDICSLINRNGMDAFLLKYRCPQHRQGAFADGARAMRFIRANAAEFEVDPARIGVIGFSAGGHLAAMLSASAETVPYPEKDDMDKLSFRPDFAALIYPAYLADDDLALAPEFKVEKSTPPALLIQAQDDPVCCRNAVAWFQALNRAGGSAELHIWPTGGHGYGVVRRGKDTDDWGETAGVWLRKMGKLP